ncbi:hypothetical protein [Halolamina salifodinae]|uniref:Uncharacterized protein n=1 Tax=Halolamina salifodinae TaxID=1202767 RepID=A0A8T4H035_9EURY|nr:hypothetical protein [Halolamina salifodinae]MBP1987922.1 hypothetical protein [Halolamina salifodinae]
MRREQLVEGLSRDILAYVMHGSFPEQQIVEELRPDGVDGRFDDYESLIRLHFVLRPDVVSFVEDLPKRLRSIRTETENVSKTSRGQVDGRINWNRTIQARYSQNPNDRSLFVCESRSEDYDIDENVVLKRLLALIHETLADCAALFEREYDWVTDRWRENLELVDVLRNIVERNVHVTRIREPAEYEPTDRMLQRAENSRSEIYREAARLLRTYRRSLAAEEDAIAELLEQTAVTPDDEETLLELYVLFRYVSAIESLDEGSFTIRTIESGSQEIARLEHDSRELLLYHDSSARGRGLSFLPEEFERPREELSRAGVVQREAQSVAETYFQDRELRRSTGRPDVIVLEIREESRREYLVTEVKNSTNFDTVRSGIKETLEYLAFLRQDGDLVFDDDRPFGSGWNGVLVVQDLDGEETAGLAEQESIRILQASEVEQRLIRVLEEVL